jgi:hypothetical protein
VEGLVPSEMVEEPTRVFSIRRARNVEAPATQDNFAPPLKRKTLGGDNAPGSPGTLALSHLGCAALRREHWERLESGHHRRNQATRSKDLGGGRNGYTPIGYSGQTALRREQCDVSTCC